MIRHHGSTLTWRLQDPRRYGSQDERGRTLDEQALSLTEADPGDPLVARRITSGLLEPTSRGEREIHLL